MRNMREWNDLQAPNSREFPNPKLQARRGADWSFWNLGFGVSLELGVWGLEFLTKATCLLWRRKSVPTAAQKFHAMPKPARNAAPMSKRAGPKRLTPMDWTCRRKSLITMISSKKSSGATNLSRAGFIGFGGWSRSSLWWHF